MLYDYKMFKIQTAQSLLYAGAHLQRRVLATVYSLSAVNCCEHITLLMYFIYLKLSANSVREWPNHNLNPILEPTGEDRR